MLPYWMRMSWIFFLLLLGYGCIRLLFRLRGNLRYLRARRQDAPPRQAVAVPAHVREGLAALFETNETVGVVLDERRRVLSMLLHVDPDANFGEIRDGRYRRTVIEVSQALDQWRRSFESLTEAEAQKAEDLGVGAEAVDAVRERLAPIARKAARARALEPFPIEQVRVVHDALVQVLGTADEVRQRLQKDERHPYRGAAAAPRPSELAAARAAVSALGVDAARPPLGGVSA